MKVENLIPGNVYLPLRLFVNKLRGRTEADVELLRTMVLPNSMVVDVGAHKGLYSIPLYRMGCIVYSFEPNAHCSSMLSRWAVGKNRVKVFKVGLSNQSGTAELKIPVDKDGRQHIASASVSKNFEGKFAIENITLMRLDDFELSSLSFLKIDVEGLEDEVLRGGIETIRKNRPIMLIEIEERHRNNSVSVVFNMIYELGYRAFIRSDSGFCEVLAPDLVDFAKLSARNLSKNFWFVHSETESSVYSFLKAR
jgi:FkbM family methyltransferase